MKIESPKMVENICFGPTSPTFAPPGQPEDMGQISGTGSSFQFLSVIYHKNVPRVVFLLKCGKTMYFQCFPLFDLPFKYDMPPKPKNRTLSVSPKLSDVNILHTTSPYSLESSRKRSLETYLFDIKFVFQGYYESCASDHVTIAIHCGIFLS